MKEACAEFEVACSEVNLQQQLEELEALILQRGLLGDANRWATAATSRAVEKPAPNHSCTRLQSDVRNPNHLFSRAVRVFGGVTTVSRHLQYVC